MILVLGSSSDNVYPRLVKNLNKSGHPYVIVDEDYPERYTIYFEEFNNQPKFSLGGDKCKGNRPVGSVFVRHAVARTLDSYFLNRLGSLQAKLNYMLLSIPCPVINQPANAYSNYSKPYQIRIMADEGFDVPKTLITNIADEARLFYEECNGQMIFKGVSNVMTLAQVFKSEHFERLKHLPNSPTLFQEYIPGIDYRVHVIGEEFFITRISTKNEDYRRSALINRENISVEPGHLPLEIIEKCICITKKLGLIVSGIDFKESPNGRLVALELNPYPQFTFYESHSGQPITNMVIKYLIQNQISDSNVFV